jgi:hypothetical protein
MHKTSWIAAAALTGLSLTGAPRAFAQDTPPQVVTGAATESPSFDENVKLMREDLRAEKKQIIAANLMLTSKEAEQFWPIYYQYSAELTAITDKKFALLKGYAQNYFSLTDEQAEAYIRGRADVEQAIMQLRLKYVSEFRKVVSGKSTALFFQLDWRLGLVADLQLASQIPLVEQ